MNKIANITILLISIVIVSCFKTAINESILYDNATITKLRNDQNYIDGPYIFIDDDQVIEKTIFNENVVTKILDKNPSEIYFTKDSSTFSDVDNIAVFSDLHGQFDVSVNILKNNNVIDDKLNWSFGKGHLVVLGDILDRGPDVTELLWLVYNLEQQAKQVGGKLHYLLGNHEFMVVHNDLRYVHEKYITVSDSLNINYDQLFNKHTFFGRWLRSKPTIIKINNILFVHGGISKELIANDFNIDKINELLQNSLDQSKTELKAGPIYNKYYGSTGPFWYRGYFTDDFTEEEIDHLLNKLDVGKIIVGHTTIEQIREFYNGKVYCVDSGIKYGEEGEILFITRGEYNKGTFGGEKIKFN